MAKLNNNYHKIKFSIYVKTLLIWMILCFVLFSIIGAIVSVPMGKKNTHTFLFNITENISSEFYLTLLSTELRPLQIQYHEALPSISFSDFLLQFITQLNRADVRTLFGNELPGFSPYQHRIVIGQTDTNYSNLPVESSPPLEIILEDRMVIDSPSLDDKNEDEVEDLSDKTVFIYNTHNRESFLPHLDDVTDPNAAFHSEVNVSLISEQMKKALAKKGIGTMVDQTDFTQVLDDQGLEYWQSYDASKPVVEEVLSQNQHINYIFDIHRDSRRKEDTTITIDDLDYARLFFVIGADFEQNEKNIELATALHEKLDKLYPGISRGVVEMGGSGKNGVYNQDVSENALLIEFGGVDNTLDELYRTVDAFTEVFADFYWDAEPTISK
ncbi:stage II sporulation protein P [Amphibacillus sp. MSJ-3]|uniref:stage II sporulation protein P n=1 Tax=Amphibacillus sp. MSJ-3 TaxID=2841505 RepID=UPI001C0F18D7|nr:stage II sporulation protein P [Amphibacillus sp. MSJ-3]MBU5595185.1 stage II sporulation protein P [Amphibacillus sp. MSJ-3]